MSQTAERPVIKRIRPAHWAGDVSGGVSAALVSLPKSIAYGAIAFAPLGPEYLGFGLVAGIYSSVVVGFVSSVFGGTKGMISGSRASTALIFAALLSQILAFDLPPAVEVNKIGFALGIGFLTIFLSGVIQLAFAWLRLGALVNYVPYPVIAGFIDASALLIILSQFWALFGIVEMPGGWGDFVSRVTPAASAIAVVTFALVLLSGKFIRFLPPAVVGLLGGSALYYGLNVTQMPMVLGSVIGEITVAYPMPQDLVSPLLAMNQETFWLLFPLAMFAALSMALLGSFDSLLTMATADAEMATRSNGNRELMAQGMGNALAALLGCLHGSGTVSSSLGSYKNGGSTRWAGIINVVLLAGFTLAFAPVISMMPSSVMVGLLIGVGCKSFDRWTLSLIRILWKGPVVRKRYLLPDLGIVAAVVMVAFATNLIVAVGVGIVLAVVLFLASVSKQIIRRSYSAEGARSHIQRDCRAMDLLCDYGGRIRVVELDGALFFGSCGQLEQEMERLIREDPYSVILDFKRVGDMDSTGAAALKRIHGRLAANGITLVLSYLREERRYPGGGTNPDGVERRGKQQIRWGWLKLRDMGALSSIGMENIFPDTETALGVCETRLLAELEETVTEAGRIHDGPVMLGGLSRRELSVLRGFVTRESYEGGAEIFKQGDRGDAVYYLVRGEVSVMIDLEEAEHKKRIQTILPGTIFGEMAVLDGKDRSASVIALCDSVCYRMDLEAVARLKEEQPELSLKLYSNLCTTFANRLRNATTMICELER